jgi:mannitol-1-phosphate 5-dehydrogenase
MGVRGRATYVGFGFGAIQAGLFALEAQASGAFRHLVIAEVSPRLVAAVRQAGGRYTVNVAHADHGEAVTVGPVTIEDPNQPADRARLVEAIAAAQEIATAVPSVRHYVSPGPGSLHRILAEGLQRKVSTGGPPAVIYTAENDRRAAAILQAAVMEELHADERGAVMGRVRFVDTVIAKMSGVITPPGELAPVTPDGDRAFLVEAFNHILISPVPAEDGPFPRGLTTFEEKADLTPFEETKLYGHNAVHALAAYLGQMAGAETISAVAALPGAQTFLRDALLEESGAALVSKYGATGDPLFTPAGMTAYADDLLARMVNPHLRDTVARVGRDPARKLGWDDRLVGAMRLALSQGVAPRRYALGIAAALQALDTKAYPANVLPSLWVSAAPDPSERALVLTLVNAAMSRLRAWREAGCPEWGRLVR